MLINTGALVIEGHVQGLSNTRALGEQGISVYVLDKSNCIARYSKYCKRFFRCPDYISEDFVSFLIELAKQEKLTGWVLIPSNDHAVYNISKNKTKLEKYYKVITPGIEVIEKIYDKSRLLSIAEKCQVPYPITQYFHEVNEPVSDTLKFPLLTKGRNGLSFYKALGKKAFFAKNENELRLHLNEIAKKCPLEITFTQELIPFVKKNKTISFTAFAVNGDIKTHWIGVKLREHPIRFGTATFTQSIECHVLFDPSQRLLHEINYTGVCEIEYLLDPRDNQYKLIEINARTWLWVELAKKCKVNYALFIYQFVNNIPSIYPKNYTAGKEWMHYVTDIPFSFLGLLKGEYSFFKLLKTYIVLPHPAVFKLKDILPFFAEFFIVPLRFIKR